ncbi:MAG TPA: hypothetical protein VM118_05355 [Acidobacteriota bacterium]|nr:hypothetical protein [Acidobacteriota bacterium]
MPHDDKAASPTPLANTLDNWQVIRPLLCERIRRRWHALRRLSGETSDGAPIEARLAQISDDAAALWQLAEEIDRELDAAFAPRARRVALTADSGARPADTDPAAFRAH